MLIPLRHENMQGRRWPVITLGIIALNVVVFLGTHWKIDEQDREFSQVKVHLIILAAMHPDAKITGKAEQFIGEVQEKNPALWKEAQNQNRDIHDAWDAKMRMMADEHPEVIQEEMDSLCQSYDELEPVSLLNKYAYIPAHPTALGLVTANFLHGGWLHLIGNMWFLWLAGAVLEDTWGRMIYPAFYMVAGVLALLVHGMVNAGSLTPTIGASGAIAGLMGAFLVRFPTTKIEMGTLILYRFYKFKMQAYWLLPLWLLQEVFYGSFGPSGVAHWAHVGGFVFGALIAVVVRKSGLEQMAEEGIQDKISWVSHPMLVTAGEQMESGKLDEAVTSLKKVLADKPDSIDSYRMLQRIYWQKSDLTAHRDALAKLLALEIKANDHEGAMQTAQDFRNSGGEKLPAALWLDFCRQLENQADVSHAADEYVALANAYPTDRQGLLAQMAAGRLYLKRLNRAEDALKLYEAASASPAPHGDWQPTIEKGIADAKKALSSETISIGPTT